MIVAFRYVFGAAAAMLACASLCMILMEEKPLAGPAKPVGDGGVGRATAGVPRSACHGYPSAAI